MALNVVKIAPFSPQWVAGLRGAPDEHMTVPIRIIDSEIEDAVYDRETGEFVTNPEAIVYTGVARVTPRRTALQHPIPGNTTNTQNVQFQIPITAVTEGGLNLRPRRHRVVVDDAPLMPALETFLFTVSEVVDSGAPIEYTFWCHVDQNLVIGN